MQNAYGIRVIKKCCLEPSKFLASIYWSNLASTSDRCFNSSTGINEIAFVDGFISSVEYYYKRSSRLIHKLVTFYLAKTSIRDVRLSFEHRDFAWKEYDLAIDQLTYQSAKKILREAKPYTESIKWI